MAVARGVYESTKADYSPLVRLGDRFTGNSFSSLPPSSLLLSVFTPLDRTCSGNVKSRGRVPHNEATGIFNPMETIKAGCTGRKGLA